MVAKSRLVEEHPDMFGYIFDYCFHGPDKHVDLLPENSLMAKLAARSEGTDGWARTPYMIV